MDNISTWLSTYWQPLLIGGVIGLILGWLFFYLPLRGRIKQSEATVADLGSKLASSDKAVKEARQQAEEAQTDLTTQQMRYNTVQGQIAALQADLEATAGQKDALDASLLERSSQMEELTAQNEQLQGLTEQLRADYAGLFAQFEQTQLERDAFKANLETSEVDLASAKQQLADAAEATANKEVALNEAYLRAVKLQRELMDHQSMLAATQTELAELRRDVASLSTLNTGLESKLQNARGEVAGELALMTSTMLRMKEDSLAQANHRIAALTAELEAMRAGKASTP
jgi:chromosome segregation ATPase